MKKSIILIAVASLSFGLVSCGDNVTSIATSANTTSAENTSVETTSVETTSSDDTPDTPENPTTLPEGSETRDYNSSFDDIVDDFSSTTAKGTISGAADYLGVPYLNVPIDSMSDDFPNSPDVSIYKAATGTYPIKDYDGIGFSIKLDSNKTISNDNLVLGLRGGDALEVYPLTLSQALDPDGSTLPALTQEYQDVIISPNQSIADDATVYQNTDGTPSTTKIFDLILGFHLYAQGTNIDADVDISSVFLVKGGEKTILDNFNHAKPNASDPSLYWRDSTGNIICRHVTIKDGGSYQVTSTSEQKNIVLEIRGDTSNTIIEVFDGTNTVAKAWNELKDSQGNTIPAALIDIYEPIVINLENSGFGTTARTITITSTAEIKINMIFASDLLTQSADPYPAIEADPSEVKTFDNFNRTQTGFDGDYDSSHSNPLVTGAGLDYALSYNADTATGISIDGSAAIFDATDFAASDYINLKEGSDAHARETEQYMVFSIKLDGGADISGFRFDGGTGVTWANDWYASSGTKSLDTPYVGTVDDGYSLYVIDLALTGIDTGINSVDMYYSGTGKLYIDDIFFTDAFVNNAVIDNAVVNDSLPAFVDTTGYVYTYGGNLGSVADPIIGLTVKGDGVANLSSIRLEFNNQTLWFKDSALIDPNGKVIASIDPLPTEDTVIYVDLIKSGYSLTGNGDLHIHAGGVEDSTGLVTIENLATYNYDTNISVIGLATSYDTSGYSYVGWLGNKFSLNSADGKYLKIVVKGDGNSTLGSLRIEDASTGNMSWVRDKQIILADGSVLVDGVLASDVDTSYLIDLTASGISCAGDVHVHLGDAAYYGVLTIESMTVVRENASYMSIYEGLYPIE